MGYADDGEAGRVEMAGSEWRGRLDPEVFLLLTVRGRENECSEIRVRKGIPKKEACRKSAVPFRQEKSQTM